ncbi:MAG: formylglycine-generating enzyme family protein, partial [Planctomycetota bacterium]
WEAVTGVLPSVQGRSGTDPVERVSWHDVNKLFLPKLQTYAPEGMVFKLPTEAQWEYACRAGTATRFWFGDDFGMLHQYGNYADVSYGRRKSAEAGVWDKHHDDGFESAGPVGRFPANPWGLNDMHGNVEEWCEDALYGYFYSLRDRDDPVLRAEALPLAVFRGGGWTMWAGAGTSAMRGGHYKDSQLPGVGFRVAMVWLSDMQAPGEKAADTHESQADGATE